MSSNKERAKKALNAMKLLGFSKKQATPVLKELLNIFNNNWEPIEDECYRALADAILDRQDNKQTPPSQQGNQAAHAHSEHDRQQYVSAIHDDRGEDDNETPLVKRPRMGTANFRAELQPFESGPQQPTVSTQGALSVSPQNSRGVTRSLTVVLQDAGCEYPLAVDDSFIVKEPKPEPQIDIAEINIGDHLTEPQVDIAEISVGDHLTDRDFLTGPDAIQLSDGSSGSGARGSMVKQAQSLGRSKQKAPLCKNGVGSMIQNTQETSFVEVDVASSANGEVKMSLKCSLESSNFSISMEEVFKMVEEKCLHSYKVLPPDFSIGKLMSEVCQSVVQLGTMHSEVNRDSGSLHNEVVAPFVKPIACEAAVDINDNVAGGSSVLDSSEPCLQNSLVAWDPEFAHCKQKTTHDTTDISKGEERVRIPIVNEFGSEKCPPSFYYVPRNLVFQNAYVNISIARIGDEDCCADCSGNCLSSLVPCGCARVTGGEFPYTPEGLLKTEFLDECTSVNHFPQEHHRFYCTVCPLERSKNKASPGPCKGHLMRKFIKECWSKCGCGMQCGNRVIQRGITCKLQVFFTREGKGWGVRTVEDLPKGSFVCEYVGEVLTSSELHERAIENARNGKHKHQVLLDAGWGSGVLRDEDALSLDGSFYGNVGRFINHRCYDANLVQIPVEVETPDHHYYHLAFFTNKKVEAFEELTWDYGIGFDDTEGPSKPFRCMCGSRYCRDPNNLRRMARAAAKRK
ncbi:putative SET-domain containing protein family [Zea mays]|uniref:Histone-lysine N-methyltransferase SUVR4 n=2 Tax=Zea mays TaxID=4577 RepID=C0PJG3_MAIZE|nr:putative SET-domain containing protein family [Zea mays]ACN35329.1 unknown [Zea mays]AQK51517.1 Histone-lysine N-methyltransferase SUVR4 [Zea mays]AQK51519.1 Histone-lysine N-methyltransferase SUVR4 [Zea mays]|eukprot:NP_001146438.1 putative SET-domain containing protein family [Zea mays]